MRYGWRGTVAGLLGVVIFAGVAVARVVTPRPGHWHGATSPRGGKDDEALFVIRGSEMLGEKISPGWTAIIAPTDFKCNEAFIEIPIRHLHIRRGRFGYHGKAVDTAGNKSTGITGTVDWTGVFTSSTTVKGTLRFRTAVTPVFDQAEYRFNLEAKACDTGVLPWKGREAALAPGAH
jgi:hypothetical protein